MLTISDSQMNHFLQVAIDKFIINVDERLKDENITNYNIEQLKEIVKDAFGANIKKESHVYRYIKIVIAEPQLQQNFKPDWVKNILYLKADPVSKINKIEQILKKKKV